MNSISLPAEEKNIRVVKKMADEKNYKMKKIRGENLWDLVDTLNGQCVLEKSDLFSIHDFLCHNDD